VEVVRRLSFQSIQSLVGVLAGLASIGSVVYSSVQYLRPSAHRGEMAAVVRDARGDRPIGGATVEILTPAGAVVSTVPAANDGSATRTLDEGTYRLRAIHPEFREDTREVHVLPGQVAEVQFRLTRLDAGNGPRRPGPVDKAAHAVNRGVGAAQRFFRGLGL
jgi:hypothetical protein